jgi:hypothetical protein
MSANIVKNILETWHIIEALIQMPIMMTLLNACPRSQDCKIDKQKVIICEEMVLIVNH